MSLHLPTFGPITINGVDYGNTGNGKWKSFWCTDEDLAYGIGQFQVTIADKDGTVAAALPAWPNETGLWKSVAITANSKQVFAGLTEKITYQVGPNGNEVVVEGYNLGSELANMFITKDYTLGSPNAMIGPRADLFLHDVMFSAYRTLQYVTVASPVVTGPAPGSYPAVSQSPGYINQKAILDIIREVLTSITFAGNIDLAGNLNMFDPIYTDNPGVVIPQPRVLYSVFPTDSNGGNYIYGNIKDGSAVRDLHEMKNYVEFTGAGSGYDPYWNGFTDTNKPGHWNLTDPLNGNTMNWNLNATNLPPTLYAPNSLIATVTPSGMGVATGPVAAQYNFGPAYSFPEAYPVQNDVDQVNGYLNLIFNRKTGLHFWAWCMNGGVLPRGVNPVTPNMQVVFTDTGGATATLAESLPLTGTTANTSAIIGSSTNSPWTEFNLPTPLPGYNPWAAGQANPYTYVGAFNFSACVSLQIQFVQPTGGGGINLAQIGLNNMYFLCQPFCVPYANPTVQNANTPNVASTTYGQRDQHHNAGDGYVNQLDLQAYASIQYSSYTSPMLRTTLTCVVDPSQTVFQAGKSIELEVPRWSIRGPSIVGAGGMAQYWRIVRVKWQGSPTDGLSEQLDVIPSSAI